MLLHLVQLLVDLWLVLVSPEEMREKSTLDDEVCLEDTPDADQLEVKVEHEALVAVEVDSPPVLLRRRLLPWNRCRLR